MKLEGKENTKRFGESCHPKEERCSKFGHEGREFALVHPLVANSDLLIKNAMERALSVIAVRNVKKVRESIFFQSSRFTTCKVRDRKLVAQFFDGVQFT